MTLFSSEMNNPHHVLPWEYTARLDSAVVHSLHGKGGMEVRDNLSRIHEIGPKQKGGTSLQVVHSQSC
jgi:hypothetical protein